jgi:hypothetical protein
LTHAPSLRRQLGVQSTVDRLEVPGRQVRLQALPIGIAPNDFLDIAINLKRKSTLTNYARNIAAES